MRPRPGNALPRNAANYAALTPLSFIARSAAVWPQAPAIVDGHVHQSWGDTYARCRRVASALVRLGVGRGDGTQFVAHVPRTRRTSTFTSMPW